MSTPATPRANKPVHNGKNSQTASAPSQVGAALNHLRQKITGSQVPKTDTGNLPMNRAKALFAQDSTKRRAAPTDTTALKSRIFNDEFDNQMRKDIIANPRNSESYPNVDTPSIKRDYQTVSKRLAARRDTLNSARKAR